MNTIVSIVTGMILASAALAQSPPSRDLPKGSDSAQQTSAPNPGVNDRTAGLGIKEALAKATEDSVRKLSAPDGYLANQAVRIPMPPKLQKIADIARTAGFQKQIDDFVVSMNRAAEAAVPLAARFFGDAIREMTLTDVRGILFGGDTAATEFFRRKTHDGLYAAFRPIVAQKINEVGATRAWNDVKSRAERVPLLGSSVSLDLEDYVTTRALDGLFVMIAQQERNIRTNPLARTTDLLKSVFGK